MAVIAEAGGGGVLGRGPDWRVAAGLSLVPGAGQLYNRQPRKAAFFFLGSLLTIGAGIVLLVTGERIGHDLLESHAGPLFLLVALLAVLVFLVLFVLGLFLWASAVADARHTAAARAAGDLEEAARVVFFRL